MAGKAAEIKDILTPHALAKHISNLYIEWDNQRRPWIEEKKELRNYIFATDTTKTTNSKLPWKNKTTIPKLTQIRDNLHANYMSALFPNDNWLKWEAYESSSADKEKRKVIEAYMQNKLRESDFFSTVSHLVYDYIDFGNAFANTTFVAEYKEDAETGEKIAGYVGPKAFRISPYDIVFNPLAVEFKSSPKIVRYIKTIGELEAEADEYPSLGYQKEIISEIKNVRNRLSNYSAADWNKAAGYTIDGFGSLHSYYRSGYVEILEFEGDLYDLESGTFYKDALVTIVDRTKVIRHTTLPHWFRGSKIRHCGWRLRQDNLYAMGPLDNLVGMQYRIDHLENLKADAMDLAVHPPIKVKGNVEEFEWGPGAEIFIGDDGDVGELGMNLNGVIAAQSAIDVLLNYMEEMAGAPKQAMGIRTPGEKTAYEVQTLENAAGRIFQEKVTWFEINIIEPLVNDMLEEARRNMDGADLIRVMDDDIGVMEFMNITKEDITAKGKLRPVGARHFAARAQLVQNISGIFNSGVGKMIAPHVSAKAMARLVEDVMGLERYGLVQDNVAIFEQAETQQLMGQAQENNEVMAATPL